jgi:hypothetical protein
MIRPATSAIVGLAIASGMFSEDEVEPVRAILEQIQAGNLPDHQVEVWVDDPAGPPAGVVYFCPNVMTDRTCGVWRFLL